MKKMTTKERIQRMFEHRQSDRIPIIDDPWVATIERWHKEGMPKDVNYRDYFDLDKVETIHCDTSPRYEGKILEETDEYIISTSSWGVTSKGWKHRASTPQFLDYTIVDMDSWRKAKARMTFSKDRIPWELLEKNYKTWRKNGHWLQAFLWFGFDVTHSWVVGTERVLLGMAQDPEWLKDMFDYFLELNLQLLDEIWKSGYTFDGVFWCDDMGYKHNQFFSLKMYRHILKPYHKRAVEWAHAKGIKTHLHSCGDVNPFIPDLLEIGVEALNPLEVKAGMDPIAIKKKYGDKLVLHGGINAVLWDDRDAIETEMRKVIPVVKENGGYIFSSDHSVPSSVSLENFRYITNLAKELGKYT